MGGGEATQLSCPINRLLLQIPYVYTSVYTAQDNILQFPPLIITTQDIHHWQSIDNLRYFDNSQHINNLILQDVPILKGTGRYNNNTRSKKELFLLHGEGRTNIFILSSSLFYSTI